MSASVDAGETGVNIVVLRGRLSSDPRRRELPSGAVVSQLELTIRHDGSTASVPVAVEGADELGLSTGDEVVVIGRVRRRFFRVGGSTGSRTEVVAERLLRPRARRSIGRAIDAVVASLDRAR